MWHFRNSWCVTQSWRILIFVQGNWFHSFCGVLEDIPLFFCFPAPPALSVTLKVLITPTELNNLIFAVTRKERRMPKSAARFNAPCAFLLQSNISTQNGSSFFMFKTLKYFSEPYFSDCMGFTISNKPLANQTVFQDKITDFFFPSLIFCQQWEQMNSLLINFVSVIYYSLVLTAVSRGPGLPWCHLFRHFLRWGVLGLVYWTASWPMYKQADLLYSLILTKSATFTWPERKRNQRNGKQYLIPWARAQQTLWKMSLPAQTEITPVVGRTGQE